MKESRIIQDLSRKGADPEKIAARAIKNPKYISDLAEALETEKGSVKFGCDKVLRLISERRPKLIYPYFDVFARLLDSENSFLKWGAIATIANLAAVDRKKKFEKIFKKYFSFIPGPAMIAAANVIGGSARIASAKPELTGRIAKEILKVAKAKYLMQGVVSPECRNVASGHAIDAFDAFFDKIKDKKPVIAFVKKQLKNPRDKARKKAEKFLRRERLPDGII